MRWRWATLSSGLLAVRPMDASYISKPPQTIEPRRAAVATNRLLGISPRITDAPIPDPPSLVGRAGALERESNTCGFYSDGTLSLLHVPCRENLTIARLPLAVLYIYSYVRIRVKVRSVLRAWHHLQHIYGMLPIFGFVERKLRFGQAKDTASDGLLASGPNPRSTPCVAKTSSDKTSANNSTDNNNNGEKKSNTNAIVGGVVGGVGGAAILGAAIFFFIRSRKKKSVDTGSATAAASQPVFQQHQQSPSPGQGSPLGYHPQAGSPVYDPNTAYKHYQGSPQPYPQPSQSPYDPHQSGHQSWGQPSPGLTSSPSPLGSPNPVSPSATTPGPTTAEQQKGQPVELAESNAVGTSANRAELA
ncbi:hypothetical protein MY10362_007005 [Beauveria mimosiformis]